MIKLIFIAMSLSLASCTTASTSEVMVSEPALLQDDEQAIINEPVNNKKPVICYEPPEYDNPPELPDTGVRRETPIDVVPKELFIGRFKASPLWEQTERKDEDRSSFRLSALNGFLQVRSSPTHVKKVTYTPLDVSKRNKDGHQLLDQEKSAMTEIIDLVINDHQKAAAILDQLYQQYSVKVKNNDVLNDGETLHSYVRYNGILFELWGLSRNTHPLEVCNFNMLTTLTVS
ncbi:hypothetical protein [Psychrobacter sp. AOP7-B1-24]|uniref:hypothetical protein n=1 Tax=Psychrobacter sp. AOP7-B1-24 TaxID=3457645 RepID=UPI00402B8E08